MSRTKNMEEFINELLSKMTLSEKVGQLNQKLYGWKAYKRTGDTIELTQLLKDEVQKFGGMGALYGLFRADPWSGATFETGISEKMAPSAANKLQKYITQNTRLGIPVLISADSPHGNMALDGYLLPVNLALGCTFNPDIIRESFGVCAKQMRTMGAHLALISGLDILREPRWGRSEECYGEDPYLSSKMAEGVVKGCQGTPSDIYSKDHVGVIMKHFCAQGACTGGNNMAPATIGERELREIHLPPMKASIDAGVAGCMAAYNEIDGIQCHANKWLLTDILRGEMDLHGIVMADGCAIDRVNFSAGDQMKSGAIALNAGVDLSLWDDGFTLLETAVNKGLVTVDVIDRSVKRVLELKYKLGLFENPYIDEAPPELGTFTVKNCDVSLKLARESVVLLKNSNTILPLSKVVKKIAVIGPNADSLYNQLGDYTPPYKREDGVTVLEGIQNIVSKVTEVLYEKGCGIRSLNRAGIDKAVEAASKSDVVIYVIGGSSTRDFDVTFDKTGAAIPSEYSLEMDCGEGVDVADLMLGGLQEELFLKLKETGKPIVVVLIEGRPYAFENIDKCADAVLCAFYPGPMGGKALAEIIFGDVLPSGRLSVTIPRSSAQLPVYYNQKNSENNPSYIDMEKSPLYPFGYGLSYTTFSYSNLRTDTAIINREDLENFKEIKVYVEVENTGKEASFTVIQLYIMGLEGSITRRIRELKGFQKIFIDRKEKRTVEFKLTKNELAVFDYAMDFKVETGKVRVYCGNDCNTELFCEVEVV